MSRFVAGLLAGTIATAVVSILMVLELTLGPGVQLSFIEALAEAFARQFDTSRNLALGWLAHLVIGTLGWGSLYALINPGSTGASLSRGVQFGLIIWLLMMVVLMPLAGKGLFGLENGGLFMLVALVQHLIYGIVLAHYYGHMLEPVGVVPRERLEHSEGSKAGASKRYVGRKGWRRPLQQR